MSNQGDDCYFYFYSTCTKGDSCAFRHCQAALGNETVCTLWQEGCCFRQICKFRHMKMEKKRSEIPCFWENQASGCQKGNCAFHHTKGRYIDGIYIPPSKTQLDLPEANETDKQTSQVPVKHPVAPTPLVLGVKKIEGSENVPSPTHPPVVINAADDDEDDDEEGDEVKNSGQKHVSPFGQHGTRVSSRKESPCMKVISDVKDTCSNPPVKNITATRTVTFSRNDPPIKHLSLAQRLGNRTIPPQDKQLDPPIKHLSLAQRLGNRNIPPRDKQLGSCNGENVSLLKKPLSERLGKNITIPIDGQDSQEMKGVSNEDNFPSVKKPLSERLGKKITIPDDLDFQATKVQIARPLKDRLGFPAGHNAIVTDKGADLATGFSIKNLPETHQKKITGRQDQDSSFLTHSIETHIRVKSRLSTKPHPNVHIKSLHEIQAEKRLKQLKTNIQKEENEIDRRDFKSDKIIESGTSTRKEESQLGITWNIRSEKGMKRTDISDPVSSTESTSKTQPVRLKDRDVKSQPIEQVRVKTLEEIRKEKALRLQQNQHITIPKEVEMVSQPQVQSSRKKIVRLTKLQVNKVTGQDEVDRNLSANSISPEVTKHTEDCGPPVTTSLKISAKEGDDNANTTYAQEITQFKDEDPLKPIKKISGKKSKGNPKGNVEPCAVKKSPPSTGAVKRKALGSLEEVKPPCALITSADKQTTVIVPVTESYVPENSSIPSPKRLKESSQVSTFETSYPAIVQTAVKSQKTRLASVGKPLISTDSDDELIWNISDDKLEDEIDLDPSKDEDDLLMELSEMIDS